MADLPTPVDVWQCHCGQLLAGDEGRKPDIACPGCGCPADWTFLMKGLHVESVEQARQVIKKHQQATLN